MEVRVSLPVVTTVILYLISHQGATFSEREVCILRPLKTALYPQEAYIESQILLSCGCVYLEPFFTLDPYLASSASCQSCDLAD